MAFPIIPVVLLSVGLFAFIRRGRSEEDETDEPEVVPTTFVFVPPKVELPAPQLDPTRQKGRKCLHDKGAAAWDDDLECKVFWFDGATDRDIARIAREEWAKRGQPTFSDLCLATKDPLGGEFATAVENPVLTEIVIASLERYYDVGPEWPPKDNLDGKDQSPYWVQQTWEAAWAVVRKELCTP